MHDRDKTVEHACFDKTIPIDRKNSISYQLIAFIIFSTLFSDLLMMDLSDDGGDGVSSATQTEEFLPERSKLKNTLDSIFSDVEKSLPSIDFEISDVSKK